MGSNGRAEFRVSLDADYRRLPPPPPLLGIDRNKLPPLDRGEKPGVGLENEREGDENEGAERSGKKLM